MIKCHDCGVEPGQIHKDGCDWEICFYCGGQMLSCDCGDIEDEKRIPYGTVREIAARIPYFSCEHIEKYIKRDLEEAIEEGLW